MIKQRSFDQLHANNCGKRKCVIHKINYLCADTIQLSSILEKILISEKEFEKIVGREKNAVSLQITQLGRQMQYRKDPGHHRPQIKNMKT